MGNPKSHKDALGLPSSGTLWGDRSVLPHPHDQELSLHLPHWDEALQSSGWEEVLPPLITPMGGSLLPTQGDSLSCFLKLEQGTETPGSFLRAPE